MRCWFKSFFIFFPIFYSQEIKFFSYRLFFFSYRLLSLLFFFFCIFHWKNIKNCKHSTVPKWKFIDRPLFLLFHLIRWNLQLLLQTENFTEICGGEIHSRVNTVGRATEECKPRKWFEIENGIAIKLFTGVWWKEIKGSFISATHKNQY